MVIIKNTHLEMHIGGIFPFFTSQQALLSNENKNYTMIQRCIHIYFYDSNFRPNFDFLEKHSQN